MYTLLLRLGAPLQSWGSASLFDTRETDYAPTKSGVVGMLAAALGRKRDASLEDLTSIKYGVRIDRQGERVTDFQITDMGEKLNSNLSYRTYLCDAIFLVGLESDDRGKLEELEHALNNPVYALFLGRRSCPPGLPLVLGIREKELYDALSQEDWLVPEWRRRSEFGFSDKIRLRILVEDEKSGTLIKDKPISFSPYKREYAYRQIAERKPKTIDKNQTLYSTEQNPMEELRE